MINNITMISDGNTTGVVSVVIINESCKAPGPLEILFMRVKIVNNAINAEKEYRFAPNTLLTKENKNL